MTSHRRSWAILPGVFMVLANGAAAGHGVEAGIVSSGAVAAEFRFTDGSAMPLADAFAFAPDKPGEPAASGRTDEHGRFAFVPDRDGAWLVEAHDSNGHVARMTLTVADHHVVVTRHAFPDWLVAVSLVFNVVAAVWLGRRRAANLSAPKPAV